MSRFMLTIASPGLIDSPPVSKVMPLPTSATTVGVRRPPAGRVVEPDQPRRRRRGLADRRRCPPKPSAASCFSSQTVTSRPASSAMASACAASQAGFLRLEGTVASIRERQPAPPTAIARARAPARLGPGGRRARPGRPGGARAPRSASGTRTSRASRRRRRPRGPRRARPPGSRWRRGPVAGRAGQRGSGPAEVLGPLLADADQQHHAERSVVRRSRAAPAAR